MSYSPNVVNLFNLNLDEEECIICKDKLNSEDIYKLPECCHIYHTNCIVTWFRNGNSNCPHCGNKGINNYEPYNYYSNKRFLKKNIIYKDLRQYAYSKQGNNENEIKAKNFLKKKFDSLKLLEDKLSIYKKEFQEFRLSLKNKQVNYNECNKKINEYRGKIYTYDRNIRKFIMNLINVSYIVPLIIPMKIQI